MEKVKVVCRAETLEFCTCEETQGVSDMFLKEEKECGDGGSLDIEFCNLDTIVIVV